MFTTEISAALAQLQKELFKLDETLDELKNGESKKVQQNKNSTSWKTEIKKMEINQVNSQLQRTPIAIIGMASIFPESRNLKEYWETILSKKDCITDVPASRWDVDAYYDPNPRAADKTYCKRGGFIPEIDFNPMEFGLPPNILEVTDVSQLLALVVAKAAMEDAGYGESRQFSRERVGVVLGVALARQLSMPLASRLEYPVWEKALKSSGLSDQETQKIIETIKSAYVQWEENAFPGMLANVVSGRIANRLDLGGMNCVVDAACASSLGALKMAVSELLEYRSDMMMTGGVDTDNSIVAYMCFSKTPAVSRGENVKPFDADSDGMMLGEGIGMLVLKRLEDAERDQDRIYALIKGIGTSSDGRCKSIYAPRTEGQLQALRRAYADAGVAPATVGLIEAHGTGTMAGDPTEVAALKEFFGAEHPQQIALGSVKSQIGHTKATAGAASLIKTALALHHKVLPATINVQRPHPKLQLETSSFYLNTETRPWLSSQPDVPRRAGVSSFGFGGTNYHVVLEEYQGEHQQSYRLHTPGQPVFVWADTPAQLQERCTAILSQLQSEAAEQAYWDLVHASKTAEIPAAAARLGFVANATAQARELLQLGLNWLQKNSAAAAWELPQGIHYRQAGLATQGKVVALFSGQGSQYLEMGRELVINFPVLRQAYSAMDDLLRQDGLQPLSATVFPAPSFDPQMQETQTATLQATQYAQPAIGVFSSSLYKIFQQAGFQPDFVAGHSFGELTALWAAGTLSDQDYFFLVKARGQAMVTPNQPGVETGAMLAVQGDVSGIPAAIKDYPQVKVANWNSPQQVVLAGARAEILSLEQVLTNQGLRVVLLPVAAAFHTPLVAHAQKPFAQAVAKVEFKPAQIPVYSNVTCKPYANEATAIQETLKQHLLNPVHFKDEIEQIYGDGGTIFLEFGPRNVLTNLVKETLGDRPHIAIALNPSRQKDSDRQLREAFVQLRVAGLVLGNLDPYQAEATILEPQKSLVNVRLSAVNFVSDKTKQAFTKALQANSLEASSNSLQTNSLQTSPSPVVPPVTPMNSPAPIEPSQLKPVPEKTTPIKPDMSVDYQQILGSIETVLEQFQQHQGQILQVHGQALQHQTEYAKIFGQLLQQQYALFGNEQFAQTDVDTKQSIVQGSERNMMKFHEHQSETLQIHGQFLRHNAEYNQHLLELVRQQYGSLLVGSAYGEGMNATGLASAASEPQLKSPLGPQDPQLKSLPTASLNGYEVSSTNGSHSNGHNGHSNGNGHNGSTNGFNPASALPPQPEAITVKAEMAPAVALVEAPASPAPVALEVDLEQLSQTLLNIVSEKTGYPVEMLELPMDMESDLGIDSIKRVEILGALLELYPGLPQPNPDQLALLRTLGEVAEYMLNQVNQLNAGTLNVSSSSASPSDVSNALGAGAEPAALPQASQPAANSIATSTPTEQALVTIAAEKTGYAPSALDLEMDLSEDLGIDPVKLTEIMDAFLEQHPHLTRPAPGELTELQTLGQILNLIQTADVGLEEKKNPQSTASSQSSGLSPEIPPLDARIQRAPVRLKVLPKPDRLDYKLPEGTIALLTDDGTPTAARLAESLQQRGWRVVVLSLPTSLIPNPSDLPANVDRIVLNDLSEAHLQEQLVAITTNHGTIGACIHLQPQFQVPQASSDQPLPWTELFQATDAAVVKQVFLLAKHLKAHLTQAVQQGFSCFLTVARLDGQFGLGQQPSFSVIPAGLFGLTKTLIQEWPEVYCRALDLHPDLEAEQSVSVILDELQDPNRCLLEVGYSASLQRTTLVCEPLPISVAGQGNPTQPNPINPISQNSIFLVSGGGRGITAQCAIEIARQHQCKFILLGRTSITEPEPAWANGYTDEAELKKQIMATLSLDGQKVTPIMVQTVFNTIASGREIRQTLATITTAGGAAEYLSVDVTNVSALRTELAPVVERWGVVTGIIHGAGNLADKRIEKKSEQDYEKVYAAKVQGLVNILACLDPAQLDRIILFSSVVGFYGNVGQADYAMANEILNKSAHLLQHLAPNCHSVAINWGPWDSGMVSPELKKAFAERNIFTIPVETGTQMLMQELAATHPRTTQVVIGSPLVYTPEVLPQGLNSYRIRRHLTLLENPFLLDHMIAERAVLPATCALTWMINACEQLYPGYQLGKCLNYKVLKGIIFDENVSSEYVLDLKEISKTETGEIEFEAKIWSQPQDKIRYHFSSRLLLQRGAVAPVRYRQVELTPDQVLPESTKFYQSGQGSLFHGSNFQGVKTVLNITPDKLTMAVELPALSDKQQGQFQVKITNPYIADVQIHAHWIWSQYFYQQGCLPSEIERYEQFAPTPFNQTIYISAEVKSKTESALVLDVIAHDQDGMIYNRMIGAKGTLLPANLEQKSFLKDVVSQRLQSQVSSPVAAPQ
jgi:acyl transferase domain-containing protein